MNQTCLPSQAVVSLTVPQLCPFRKGDDKVEGSERKAPERK